MVSSRAAVFLALAALCVCFVQAQAPTFITVISGQNGVDSSRGISSDLEGNVYIAEQDANRIRKLFLNGTLVTIAGVGSPDPAPSGFTPSSGNGGYAYLANIDEPRDTAVDAAGNVYFTERGSHVIRRINVGTGNVEAVAGDGGQGTFTDGATATATNLDEPEFLAFHPDGRLFFTQYNDVVGYIDDQGKVYEALTVPNNGDIAFDKNGNLYATPGSDVKVYDKTFANTATYTGFTDTPTAVVIDEVNNLLYIADYGDNLVVSVPIGNFNGVGKKVYGDGVNDNDIDSLGDIYSIALVNGKIYATSDSYTGIRVITPNVLDNFPTLYPNIKGKTAPGSSTCAQNESPFSVGYDPATKTVYYSDDIQDKILAINNGQVSTFFGDGTEQTGTTSLNDPIGVFVSSFHNALLVAETGNHGITLIDLSTKLRTATYGTGSAGRTGNGAAASTSTTFDTPYYAIASTTGDIYISETGIDGSNAPCIRKIAASGLVSTVITLNVNDGYPGGLVLDEANSLLFFIQGDKIYSLDLANPTTPVVIAGDGNQAYAGANGSPAASASFYGPFEITAVRSGNSPTGAVTKLVVTDTSNAAIRVINLGATPTVDNLIGDGNSYNDGSFDDIQQRSDQTRFNYPTGIFYSTDGLFATDAGEGYVVKITNTGLNLPITSLCTDYPFDDCLSTCDAFCNPGNQADRDNDAVCDDTDNCPTTRNTDQKNYDGDAYGDACDNCKFKSQTNQADTDADGHGDACDNCLSDFNPFQEDTDLDGTGDICDATVNGTPATSGSSGNRPSSAGVFSIWKGPTHQAAPAVA